MRPILLLLLLAALPTVPAAQAAPPAPGATPDAAHDVQLALVAATRGEPSIDPALGAFRRDLSALPYQRFQARKTAEATVDAGGRTRVELGDLLVTVALDATTDSGYTVSLGLSRGDRTLTRTTATVPWGRAHVLSAGRDGDAALVVPVKVAR